MQGTTLSHYSIIEELGRGGMGIVYKAEDTKLDRTVAIKVLPAAALASEDDRARFYREAKAAAALNHPHIAAIHEIDEAVPEGAPSEDLRPFIAMEYIEGGTLEDRTKEGPLKLAEAVRIATQIADALKAAHGKEIVHRDIKSANIMLTEDGQAKVLDFGLAQTAASTKLTRMGSTLGTVAFMSPEQARGEEVDGRTDLYSLGAVLYEMVAGRPPFGGEYEQAVVYSILNAEPEPLTALRSGVPMEFERITNKLLAKEARRRYQSAADLIVDLEEVPTQPSGVSTSSYSTIGPAIAAPAAAPTWQQRFFWGIVAAAVLIGLLVGIFGAGMTDAEDALKPLQRVEIALPGYDDIRFPRISPDGKYLAFRAVDMENQVGLFLRNMSSGQIRYIENSQAGGRWEYDFSPAGDRIAFTEGVNGGVFTVVVPNGIPERKTEFGRFAYWRDENTIIANDDRQGGGESYTLDLTTNEMTAISMDKPESEEGYGYLVKTHVPGTDRAFGHQLIRSAGSAVSGDFKVFTVDLKSGNLEMTEPFVINPEYVKGGFLTYQLKDDNGELVVRPIDERTGQFSGQPMTVRDDGSSTSWSRYAITPDGDFLYTTSQGLIRAVHRMWIVNLEEGSTEQLEITLPDDSGARDPRFSSDDSRIAFTGVGSPAPLNIYMFDLQERLQYQMTFDDGSFRPTFGPDDSALYFAMRQDTTVVTVELPTNAVAGTEPELILEHAQDPAISPDGKWMAAARRNYDAQSLELVLINRETGEIEWIDTGDAEYEESSFSPDSRYVAFNSVVDDINQMVVRPVSGTARHVIPNIQGEELKWLSDGGYLYYEVDEGIGRIPVRTQPTFNTTGEPEMILRVTNERGWDISADGNTIVVVTPDVSVQETSIPDSKIFWYQNWSDHLRQEFDR